MNLRLFFFYIFLLCTLSACVKTNDAIQVKINTKKVYQRIEGFGASVCRTLQFVGENWPESKREAIADLLFSGYKTDDDKKLFFVAIYYSGQEKLLSFQDFLSDS